MRGDLGKGFLRGRLGEGFGDGKGDNLGMGRVRDDRFAPDGGRRGQLRHCLKAAIAGDHSRGHSCAQSLPFACGGRNGHSLMQSGLRRRRRCEVILTLFRRPGD